MRKLLAVVMVLGLCACSNFQKSAMTTAATDRKPSSTGYWEDIVNLCQEYSTATHPPCNKANGADMILGEVARTCVGDNDCLNTAVKICAEYSLATHPPCNAANGLSVVLSALKDMAQSYPLSAANGTATQLSGDPARNLFKALVQADLKTTQVVSTVVNVGTSVVDQKVAIKDLNCKLAYDGMGTMLGTCSAKDVDGKSVKMGSAASAQILSALPDGFADGAAGHFTASASAITCEIDSRHTDSTGTAVASCTLN